MFGHAEAGGPAMSLLRERARRKALAAGIVSSGVTVAAMIATPLLPKGGPGRRLLSGVVVTGLFATTKAVAIRRWGPARAGVAAGTTVATTAAIERVGTSTGAPFGQYRYTGALRPEIAGVPAIVPLAWFAMGLPARDTAHALLGTKSNRLSRAVVGSAALTAWDLFLDPQMVGEGYWRWLRRGAYRGIPLSNFVGWFVTGLGIMALLDVLLPPDDEADGALVGEYAYMAVMETAGFARYFRDPVVAAVGGAAMLPLAAGAVARKLGG